MAKEDFETTPHILSRIDRLDDAPQKEIDSAIERLSIPLAQVEYGERGEINLEGNGWKMHFEYEPTARERVDSIADGTKWRELTVATIDTPKGIVDINKLLQTGGKIFLQSDSKITTGVVKNGTDVLMFGDLATPRALAIFLHEIGHVVDIDQLDKTGEFWRLTKIDDHEYSAEAAVLRRERVASAFALKMMRPFLNPQQRKDVLLYLKHYALKSYYKDAKRGIAAKESTKAEISHYALQEYDADMAWLEQQNAWDDFLEWKESPAYAEWNMRNPDVPEDEEFGRWQEEREVKE